MDLKSIKKTGLALAFGTMAGAGLVACNKGTEPGETNVERGKIEDTGELVGETDGSRYSDTADIGEKYYDHADHDNHDDNNNKVIGDGAYDGAGTGTKRPETGSNNGN